ncbi:phosphopyruvate hydratase [candidate division WOR-3 bacterium RBG_13_43_14]|uniref:Enolase n=1 Tax=candidate division WOR-3 bacterium RBG_13_43_14 TaxID=1802590 RepID=A0A1F4U862_UNCW3|nr:MAG: phosphopyruvate hydratase [candidate division WOR-3 bacterium RBG_13_43_14]
MDRRIKRVQAREILDSRGNPTVEVEVVLNSGVHASASVPSGASTGTYESVELRDSDSHRYGGKGVFKAVNNVNDIIGPALIGQDVIEQTNIDKLMISLDGTSNKSGLGANALCGVSLAIARTAAVAVDLPLYRYLGGPYAVLIPVPMMNVINGGIHTLQQGPDYQEYMIVPYGADTFREALRWGSETYHALKKLLMEKGFKIAVADEGGFVPAISSNEDPLKLIVTAIERGGYRPGEDIGIGLDVAASAFYKDGKYNLRIENNQLTSEEMIDRYAELVGKYPIVSIEDGLSEDDWSGWEKLNAKLGEKIQLVGDDIFVTNVQRIERGIKERVANAVLIKPNQIGTLTETIAAVKMAQKVNWRVVVSHRSGETVDSFIADFTVAMGTGALKTGAPCRGERIEKYNQLLRIEDDLREAAMHPSRETFLY